MSKYIENASSKDENECKRNMNLYDYRWKDQLKYLLWSFTMIRVKIPKYHLLGFAFLLFQTFSNSYKTNWESLTVYFVQYYFHSSDWSVRVSVFCIHAVNAVIIATRMAIKSDDFVYMFVHVRVHIDVYKGVYYERIRIQKVKIEFSVVANYEKTTTIDIQRVSLCMLDYSANDFTVVVIDDVDVNVVDHAFLLLFTAETAILAIISSVRVKSSVIAENLMSFSRASSILLHVYWLVEHIMF
ncbi:Hypothetical predicted protein [Octopus vulgaris]|uniref:Uncharacterized protein n=1 Tax=Octopus vulgaris TaxID=6645 RepID=A0AA36F9C2_OCTVU|nr:Hypothetical predicted protein [Octopus vulgaris]